MLEREQTLYAFNLNYLRMLLADLDESDMNRPAYEGGNPPVWILGHLAICTDFAGQLLGLDPVCPRAWHKLFAPGTKPADLEPPLPTKAELVAAIENGHERVSAAAPNANASVLDQPHQVAILQSTPLKTNGDVLAHLMTTHACFHLAQLSACRRTAGKAAII